MKVNLKKVFFFIICCCFIFSYTYFCSTLFNDEIWNYGFAYNIASGLVPYRDFNMIVTPLYSFLASVFIIIFGHHLWSIHILNALMITSMLFFMSKVIGKKIMILFPVLLFYSYYPGYNLLTLFFLITLLFMCDNEVNNDILFGIIVGLIFLTKQTVGICLTIPVIFYSKSKKKTIISFMIPILLFLIYLIYNNALFQFIDYCFLGMFDFCNSNKMYLFFPIEVIICIVLFCLLIKSNFKDKELFYVLMYQIITFPICDSSHFMMGFIPIFYYILKNICIVKYRIKYYFVIILFTTMIWNYSSNDYKEIHFYSDKSSYLYGRYVDKYIEDSISVISDYMERVKNDYDFIYLLTQNSYEIKLNTSYPINKFDLINNGNMGYHGSDKYINEIQKNCSDNSCLFICYRYENKITQTNFSIIDYVYNNYKRQEDVDVFDIFDNS